MAAHSSEVTSNTGSRGVSSSQGSAERSSQIAEMDSWSKSMSSKLTQAKSFTPPSIANRSSTSLNADGSKHQLGSIQAGLSGADKAAAAKKTAVFEDLSKIPTSGKAKETGLQSANGARGSPAPAMMQSPSTKGNAKTSTAGTTSPEHTDVGNKSKNFEPTAATPPKEDETAPTTPEPTNAQEPNAAHRPEEDEDNETQTPAGKTEGGDKKWYDSTSNKLLVGGGLAAAVGAYALVNLGGDAMNDGTKLASQNMTIDANENTVADKNSLIQQGESSGSLTGSSLSSAIGQDHAGGY